MCSRPANPELRAEIIRAAWSIVEECGPDCVTMRQVADRIGYSPTTIYLYFKDKSALLRDTVLAAFDDLNDTCDLAMVGPTALDKMRQRSRAYVVWGLTHPGLYRLMFEAPLIVAMTPEDTQRARRGLAAGADQIKIAIENGELGDVEDGRAFGNALWAGLHGTTSLSISGRLAGRAKEMTPAERLEMATKAADVLVNGVLASALPCS